jgi:hypothetical protein
MSADRPELRLVRESLEAVVAPTVASSVVFEALEATGGRIPEGAEGAIVLVDGALRKALAKRLGEDADAIVDDLVRTLRALAPKRPPPIPSAAPDPRQQRRRDLDVTREVVLDDRPVIVAVVAGNEDFCDRLQASLGAARVTALPAATIDKLGEVINIGAPQIVLIDAADFAAIEPEDLAKLLEALPLSTVRAIWGADLPYGASLLRAMIARKIPATPFDRREGIDPLLDLVRSRRAS